jgi:hypothetical protein
MGAGRGEGGVEVAEHSPIRTRQLALPRHTGPDTDGLADLRSLAALDAGKDVEEDGEPVLRLASQIPEGFLLFLLPLLFVVLALVVLPLGLSPCLGRLDNVPQHTQDRWAKGRVGIELLCKPLTKRVFERYGEIRCEVRRIRAICGEGGRALICEDGPDFCSTWIPFGGEVGESVDEGQERLPKMRERRWMQARSGRRNARGVVSVLGLFSL